MMKKELLVSVLMMFCLLSCNNDLIDDCKENVNPSMTKSVDFVPDTMDLKFIYQNKQYMSTCLVYDDYIDVLDEEVKVVYKSIKSKPMAALMRHDGFVEYFDKEEDLLKKFGEHMKMKRPLLPKALVLAIKEVFLKTIGTIILIDIKLERFCMTIKIFLVEDVRI